MPSIAECVTSVSWTLTTTASGSTPAWAPETTSEQMTLTNIGHLNSVLRFP